MGESLVISSGCSERRTPTPRQRQSAVSKQTGRTQMTMRPDPTFHASPSCDGSSRRETRLYVAAQPGLLKARRACGDRHKARLAHVQPDSPHGDDAIRATSSTISAGTPAHPALSPLHRPRVPGTALSRSSPGFVPRASMSSTPSPIPPKQRSTRSSSPRRCSRRPATRGPTPSIAVRKASTSARSAVAVRMAPRPPWRVHRRIARVSTSSASWEIDRGPPENAL